MAQAKTCDRCGIFYEHYGNDRKGEHNAVWPVFTTRSGEEWYRLGGPLDLCPLCKDDFDAWVQKGSEDVEG